MVSGITVGILKEQHSDHIILSDSSRVQLPDGLVLERFPSGSSLTILYGRDGAGEMVVQSITRSATSHLHHLPPPPATDHRRWGYTDAEWR
jgi:hypothetical protein